MDKRNIFSLFSSVLYLVHFSILKRVEERYALSPPPARDNIHTISENVRWKRIGDKSLKVRGRVVG